MILFGPNGGDRALWRRLTRSLQGAAGGRALVMVDQEGGDIRTVGYAGPQESQPFQGPPRGVRRAARGAGRQLRAAGINVNLAPVADVPRPGSVMAHALVCGRRARHRRAHARIDPRPPRRRRGGHREALPGPRRRDGEHRRRLPPPSACRSARDLVPFRAAVEEGCRS